jgi:hypothetical protein
MRKRRIADKPDWLKVDVRDFGGMLQAEAVRLARKLEERGAAAPRYLWPWPYRMEREQRRNGEVVEIPAWLADMLHAVMLSLIPRPRGRPPKKSTTMARKVVEAGFSKQDISRLIASEMKENPENLRRRLRQKPKPRKPRG